MGNRMISGKQRTVLMLLVASCIFLAACSRNPGDNGTGKEPTAAISIVADVSVPAATDTPTPTITPKPTITPTPTVTPPPIDAPTPIPELDIVEIMKQNKALHEAAMPERKANPLGTGPELTEQDWWDITYGEEPIYDPVYDEKEGKAGGVNPYSIVQITSSRNEEVTKKINECLENTARTLADPGYLPDVAGILNIVKEKGFPRTEVYSDCDYVCREILSVRIICNWTWWAEDRSFPDWNAFYYDWKGREEVLVGPGIELEYEVLQEINGGPILRVYYVVREVHYLNFDRRTGEVLSLSDMFPKGFDYLEYVNREAKKETNRYRMAEDDVFWMAKEDVFGFSDDEYRKTGEVRGAYGQGYDESLFEYDGGLLPVQLAGDEEFGLIGKAYLTIKDNHGKHISIVYKEIFAD